MVEQINPDSSRASFHQGYEPSQNRQCPCSRDAAKQNQVNSTPARIYKT